MNKNFIVHIVLNIDFIDVKVLKIIYDLSLDLDVFKIESKINIYISYRKKFYKETLLFQFQKYRTNIRSVSRF